MIIRYWILHYVLAFVANVVEGIYFCFRISLVHSVSRYTDLAHITSHAALC